MSEYRPGRIKLVLGLVFAIALMIAGFVLITKTAGAVSPPSAR